MDGIINCQALTYLELEHYGIICCQKCSKILSACLRYVFLEQNGFLPGVFVPKTAFVELPLVDFGTKQCLIKCFCSKISIGRAIVFLFWNKVTSWQEFCSKNLIGLK